MEKIVFMFPGVGSQYTGMGKAFYQDFKVVRETFEEAGDALHFDMAELCFSPDEKDKLARLEYSQAALVTLSMATFRVWKEEIAVEPRFGIGHSLGEYSALCCAGAVPFADALNIVSRRGLIINEVSASLEGTMMWVVNLESKIVEDICREVSAEKAVYVSAYDTPTQTSISGFTGAVMTAAGKLEKAGAIVYPLKMSGPFHSPLMKEASERLRTVLEGYSFSEPLFTVIANQNAQPYQGAGSIIENLSLQLIQPIRLQSSIDVVLEQGATLAVEMGPKNVLKFLMQKNSPAFPAYSTDNPGELQTLKDKLLVTEADFLPILARCLGAAVSTKNNNPDNDQYQENVVKPYRKLEKLYAQLDSEGNTPSREQVIEALEILRSILAAKRVSQQQQQYRVDLILKGKILKDISC
ncbi:MAG: ACP S-malonyltransferase [bacterium]|nr:ACP S-malonyltransferase [bacterium]